MSAFSLAETFASFNQDRNELIEADVDDYQSCLDGLIDALAVSPDSISEEDHFQAMMALLDSFGELEYKMRERLLDLIITGLLYQAQNLNGVEPGDDVMNSLKELLERYSFLLHWYLVQLEDSSFKGQVTVHTTGKSRPKVTEEFAAATEQVCQALEACVSVLKLNLGTIFVTSSEKDLFTGLFLKPVYLFMESEQLLKNQQARLYLFKVICMAVKSHQQQANVHTSLMQLLIYYEHVPEPLAELLQIMFEQYDHTAITDEMLKELSNRNFNSNDTKGPKLVSMFMTKLAQLAPQVLIKQMTSLVKLLESDSFTLRCAIIEAAGLITVYLAKQPDEDVERSKQQLFSIMDLVEERVLDVNPYARAKAMQALTSICDLEAKFASRRLNMTNVAVKCLQDRSIIVRRNSIKLLTRLVSTHPFGQLHGSQLELSEWQKRLEQVQAELDKIKPKEDTQPSQPEEDNSMQLDEPSDNEGDEQEQQQQQQQEQEQEQSQQQPQDNTEMIHRLKLTKKYYSEAIEFIKKIHIGIEHVETLLFSKNKNEIIDAMDFFVLADAYGIETARTGIRKMIHLVWAKANNDEGQAIQTHLVNCYRSLFFEAPFDMNENDSNLIVARNLISLTYSATLAELASLEYLLVMAMEKDKDLINPGVIKMLWKIYGYQQREISRSQRRGAIIILGMLAKADSAIATTGMEFIMKIGLDEQGRKDLGLAKYSCIALQQIVSDNEWKKPQQGGPPRFPKEHEVIERLCQFLLLPWSSMEWFGVAEEAIEAINDLCDTPDHVFTRLIQIKLREAFENGNQDSMAQLLFIVGEVSLKTMVHLERCEALFKRSKIELEKQKATEKEGTGNKKKDEAEEDDLEMVGGGNGQSTTEDDFTEAVQFIRERELLYGEKSLLARFGPMVADICKQGLRQSQPEHIQVASTLCLSKFMCVSATYCDENLAILMTLLERSQSSHIRSNCVLAMGDMAVCFNHILDDNTDFLYRRLHDKYPVVQRTCLMTLTFLILAGQVKVKGQLGEMAKCLEDEDPRISNLARMFFTELSTKDNAIYNGFIDMFSVLSADENLKPESLHKILKFLVTFIDKDKQIKNLADKLHTRMTKCESNKIWNDIAFVLNLLPHKNEQIAQTIQQGFKYVTSVS